jgi:hypothetical protein
MPFFMLFNEDSTRQYNLRLFRENLQQYTSNFNVNLAVSLKPLAQVRKMIRAKSLKRITEEIVLNKLAEPLQSHGFKHIKTQNCFKKSKGNFDHIIYYSAPYSPLVFDEETDELLLKIDFCPAIISTKFDKWVDKTLKARSHFRHNLEFTNCIEVVDYDQLNEADFFEPSASRKFKNNVFSMITGTDTTKRTDIAKFIAKLPEIVTSFNNLSAATGLYEHSDDGYRAYYRLLVFEKELALAKELYQKKIEELKTKIQEKLKINPDEAKKSIQAFEGLNEEANILVDIEVSNPFTRDLKKAATKDQKIRLAPKLGYKEHLRFDTSMIDFAPSDVNDKGEMLLNTTNGELIKINADGEFKTIAKLAFDNCFERHRICFETSWLKNPGVFACNNFIIEENDEIIELPLAFDTSSYKENSLDPKIKELVYDEILEQFHILFTPKKSIPSAIHETYHFIYNRKGTLISTKMIERNCIKLNLPRKELIATCKDNSFDILDFDGSIKANYKFGDGNHNVALSPDGKWLICHFYRAKSQCYNLETGKKKTLWAHPTYIKGYKEKFYSDIHNNFGLTNCVFSPDGSYIVGGADHGKYVVWDTTKFERKELVPSEAAWEIFNWYTSTLGRNTKNYFVPYIAKLEDQEFFVSRGYSILDISFIDQGKYIITSVGKSLLVWDAEFKNVGHVWGIDKVICTDNYLVLKTAKELVIFKRDLNFNDSFESSVFKERTEEILFVRNLFLDEVAGKSTNDVYKDPKEAHYLFVDYNEIMASNTATKEELNAETTTSKAEDQSKKEETKDDDSTETSIVNEKDENSTTEEIKEDSSITNPVDNEEIIEKTAIINPVANKEVEESITEKVETEKPKKKKGFFARLFGRNKN